MPYQIVKFIIPCRTSPCMANWTKLLYVLVIALLFVPMVFLGSNVFFPEYTGSQSYYQPIKECYPRYAPSDKLTPAEQQQISEQQQVQIEACLAEQRVEQAAWEAKRNVYNGWKYAAIIGFTLAILLLALFLPLQDAVLIGLFFGSVVTAFGATVSYWEYARTKLGFGLMLVTFFVVLFVVNKRAQALLGEKKKR